MKRDKLLWEMMIKLIWLCTHHTLDIFTPDFHVDHETLLLAGGVNLSDSVTKKVQELNSRTEAPFPIFNSNIFHFGKSSNMAYNMFLGQFQDNFSSVRITHEELS